MATTSLFLPSNTLLHRQGDPALDAELYGEKRWAENAGTKSNLKLRQVCYGLSFIPNEEVNGFRMPERRRTQKKTNDDCSGGRG